MKIKDMPAKSLVLALGAVQKEICLTTGLKVDDATAKDFGKLFIKFVMAHYGMLAPGEVSLAFILNASSKLSEKVELYGTTLTIEHIGKVLSLYMRKRAELAKKLKEDPLEVKELPPPTEEQQKMEDKKFANEYYRKFLNHEFSSVSKEYAHMVYDILDANKLIPYTAEQKKLFMEQADRVRQQEIAAPALDYHERKAMNKLMEAYINEQIPSSEIILVKNNAKRLALFDLFNTWKAQGKRKVFEI